jgi:hypothetical protein
VVQGVPPRVYLKLDSGDKRRAADWMHHYGEDNAKVTAAALRVLWTFDEGALCSNKEYPSNDEIKKTLDTQPEIRQFNTSTFAKSVKGIPGPLTKWSLSAVRNSCQKRFHEIRGPAVQRRAFQGCRSVGQNRPFVGRS